MCLLIVFLHTLLEASLYLFDRAQKIPGERHYIFCSRNFFPTGFQFFVFAVSLLGRNAALNREREPELTSIAMATLSPDSPSSHQQHDHAPLESRPSTASTSSQSKMSPLRALVRTLTPKRRKPILVKAGFRREHAPGEEERDLRVTFDLPRYCISLKNISSLASFVELNKFVPFIAWQVLLELDSMKNWARYFTNSVSSIDSSIWYELRLNGTFSPNLPL